MVFIKPVKLIDNTKYIAIGAFAPTNSYFVFIVTTLKIIIIRKVDFLEYFKKFRSEFKNGYSFNYSLASIQQLKECFFLEPPQFISAQLNVLKKQELFGLEQNISEIQVKGSKVRSSIILKCSEQKYQQTNQQLEIESFGIVNLDILNLYGFEQGFFELVRIKLPRLDIVNIVILNDRNQIIILYENMTLSIFEVNLCIPSRYSTSELKQTVNFKEILQSSCRIKRSHDQIEIFSPAYLYALEIFSNYEIQMNRLMPFKLKKKQQTLTKKAQITHFVYNNYTTVVLCETKPYAEKQIIQINNKSQNCFILSKDEISCCILSQNFYIQYCKNELIDFEKTFTLNEKQLYHLFITSIIKIEDKIRKYAILIYALYEHNNLFILEINNLKSEIKQIFELNAYEYLYCDEKGNVGSISFTLDDIGIVMMQD